MDKRMLLTMGMMMMGGGGGSLLPFSDDFSAELPQWTGATWGVAAGVASNTPTLGSELVTNGDMETGDPPTGWSDYGSPTTKEANTSTPIGGSQDLHVVCDANFEGATRGIGSITAAQWLQVSSIGRVSGGNLLTAVGVGAFHITVGTSSGTNVSMLKIERAPSAGSASIWLASTSGGGGQEFFIDDASVKVLTLASLFRSINAGTADVSAQVEVTRTANTQAGLVMCLDDAASPANFVIVYLDGSGNVKVEKCVAGTYASVSSNSVTYSASAILKCVKSGTSFTTTYNGNAVATDTISDAGIVDNGRHGLFSTYSANVFDDYLAEAA